MLRAHEVEAPERPEFDIVRWEKRLGRRHLLARLHVQVAHASDAFGGAGVRSLHIENMPRLMLALAWSFRLSGLYSRAYRGFLDLRTLHNEVQLEALPPSLSGYRLLHLSDLDLDLDSHLTDVLIEKLAACEYDLCVITGDFRNETSGAYEDCVAEMERLLSHIKSPVYAVAGNHDFLEEVDALEALGIRFLMNEAVRIEKAGNGFWFAGIDDPVFYLTGNVQKALEAVDPEEGCVLLSHAPGAYRTAEGHGVDLMLCGHTHGGQLCLPTGIALISNDVCKRSMINGAWHFRRLQGYTSSGTGSGGVPLRLFCPPQLTIHHLRAPEPGSASRRAGWRGALATGLDWLRR